jgi:hypothetical protein
MRKLRCIGLFLVAAQLGFAQSQSTSTSTSHDEAVVRETYAKVAYAVQFTAVTDAMERNLKEIDADTLARDVTAREIHFKFNSITTGNLRDIAERSYNDFVTKPEVSDEINLSGSQMSVTDDGASPLIQYGASGEWHQPPAVTKTLDWGGLKVGPVAAATPGHDRYAALTVTVSYLGRSLTYKSLWLFDSSGKQPVVPIDLITGNSVLAEFVTRDATPTALLDTRMFSTRPAVRQWLLVHQIPDGSCKGVACCLPETMQCGVTASAVSRALAKYPEHIKIDSTQTGTLDPPSTSSTRP